MAIIWQWSFHLISINTPNWTDLWIPSPNLIAPPNKFIFGCKLHWSPKRKKTKSCEKWLLGSVLQKCFPRSFTKFTENYLYYSHFLTLLKTFKLSGLQLYSRETPSLVFQNQPFIDPLQNRCSWLIHKIQSKTAMLESLFK